MTTTLVRAAYFSCGYAYQAPGATREENRKAFGALAEAEGYGRNFRIEVSLAGPVDAESGMIVNLTAVDLWIKNVTQMLDHRFLNTDLEYFKTMAPTPENIVRFIFNEIQTQINIPNIKLTNVRLFENENRWLDFYL